MAVTIYVWPLPHAKLCAALMNDPVATHHVIGYLCLFLGIVGLLAVPTTFVVAVNTYFEYLEEENRLDYAVTPEFLRKPWYFALKGNLFKGLLIFRGVLFGICYIIIAVALIVGGIMTIREP